jgi:hypothetical protein
VPEQHDPASNRAYVASRAFDGPGI